MLSQEALDIIFEDTLVDSSTIHGAIVVIDGKIWRDKHYNRFIFPDRGKAMRAFYDSMKWRAINRAYVHSTHNHYRNDPAYRGNYIGESGYLFTAEEYDICHNWGALKRDLINNHNFQIINI